MRIGTVGWKYYGAAESDSPESWLEIPSFIADWLRSLDLVLIATDHSCFDWEHVVRHSRLVVDTRNATKAVTKSREKIWKA